MLLTACSVVARRLISAGRWFLSAVNKDVTRLGLSGSCCMWMCLFVCLCLFTVQQDTAGSHYKAFINPPFTVLLELVDSGLVSLFFLGACWALYCGPERAASSDSFVVYSDSVDLFMSLVLCQASLKARRDCTALDRVWAYRALTLIFDWQQTLSATVTLALSQAFFSLLWIFS